MKIERLSWDSAFFRKAIGRISWQNNLIQPSEEATNNFELIYVVLGEPSEVALPNFYETYSAVHIEFCKHISDETSLHFPEGICSFDVKKDSVEPLYELAFVSGWHSRYKLDKNFSDKEFKSLYKTWINNSITGQLADGIFTAKVDHKIVGFATFKNHKDKCVYGLMAVAKEVQGKGFGLKLMRAVEHHTRKMGIPKVTLTTQENNETACSIYTKMGFKINRTYIIKHFWRQ